MTKSGLIGLALSLALSLALATPVMAMHAHHHHYGYFHALKFYFGSTHAGYYRGWYDFDRKNTFD